jgi:uncharacterized protein YyaL (SSP411 family)
MRHSFLLTSLSTGLILLLTGCPGSQPGNTTSQAGQPGGATALAPDAPPAGSNHLFKEHSLYLQQHVHNPVDWYPWGPVALQKAQAEKKFIFLSIGYASCHWCHVMEDEVFSQPDVAAYMNSNYICIKVDREERPDLDAAYTAALQHIKAGAGGWPLNMWLTADLKPIYGDTALPKDEFLKLSQRFINTSINNPSEVTDFSTKLAAELEQEREAAQAGTYNAALFDTAAKVVTDHADMQLGGIKGEQKFPLPVTQEFLLQYYRRTGNPAAAKWLKLTLDRMADGGLYDHVGGGFHRYSTDPAWVVPHFEKMLADNAQLAGLYLDAAQSFHEPRYSAVAKDTLDFLLDNMSSPDGGFYSSFDANSDGREGAYYVWTKDEVVQAGGGDGAALAAVLGVGDTPNFKDSQGKVAGSVLLRRSPDPAGLFGKYRPALRAARDKRAAPALDKKVVTAWNGMALSACAKGYLVLGDQRYLDRATATADMLWKVHHQADGSLQRASNAGLAEMPGVLEDYADLARGMLDLYEAAGRVEDLQHGLDLLAYARQHFANPQGGFFQTADGAEAPLGRLPSWQDGVEPSGGGALLLAMLQAAALTGQTELYTAAEAELKAAAGTMQAKPQEMPAWMQAAQLNLGPYYEVVIAGDPSAPDTRALVAAYRSVAPLNAVLLQIPAAGPDAEQQKLLPALEGKQALQGKATGYVCEHGSCQIPSQDPARFKQQLQSGWKH